MELAIILCGGPYSGQTMRVERLSENEIVGFLNEQGKVDGPVAVYTRDADSLNYFFNSDSTSILNSNPDALRVRLGKRMRAVELKPAGKK